MSSLYNLVNVPSAVWVDEEGRVLRINEGTYSIDQREQIIADRMTGIT